MNEHNAFELELAALKPQPPSAALKQQLADKMQGAVQSQPRPRAGRAWWSAAGIAGIAATCLTVALLVWPGPAGKPEPNSPFAPLDLPVAAAFDDALPTVWTYRHALDRSPQDLDALLDKHAASASTNNDRTAPHLYIGLNSGHFFNGEL